MLLTVCFVIYCSLLILGVILGRRKIQNGSFSLEIMDDDTDKEKTVLTYLLPLAMWLMIALKVKERLSARNYQLQHLHALLYSQQQVVAHTNRFLAQQISYVLIAILLSLGFAAINQDLLLLGFGFAVSASIPFLAYQQLLKKVEQRKQQILLTLPEFVNQLILLINAGETVQQAMKRVTSQWREKEQNPFTEQLVKTLRELENNVPFPKALEELSRRCGVQEVALFSTTILLNYKRGGNELIFAMRLLAKEMWEKRKAVTKTLGEQASSKLVFPMVLIFGVILLILATPAILML